MKNWTHRHTRFVEEYAVDFNGAAAAVRAGYAESRARQTAYDLLQDEDIQAAIQKRLDELSMSAAEATKRMSDMARADIADCYRVEEETDEDGEPTGARYVVLDLVRLIEEGKSHLVHSIKPTRHGRQVEMHDAKDALKQIMKAHGLFVQKHEHTGRGGGPIATVDLASLDEKEADELVAMYHDASADRTRSQ